MLFELFENLLCRWITIFPLFFTPSSPISCPKLLILLVFTRAYISFQSSSLWWKYRKLVPWFWYELPGNNRIIVLKLLLENKQWCSRLCCLIFTFPLSQDAYDGKCIFSQAGSVGLTMVLRGYYRVQTEQTSLTFLIPSAVMTVLLLDEEELG